MFGSVTSVSASVTSVSVSVTSVSVSVTSVSASVTSVFASVTSVSVSVTLNFLSLICLCKICQINLESLYRHVVNGIDFIFLLSQFSDSIFRSPDRSINRPFFSLFSLLIVYFRGSSYSL